MYIPRDIDKELAIWCYEKSGKPLLVRGARQVGKLTQIYQLIAIFTRITLTMKIKSIILALLFLAAFTSCSNYFVSRLRSTNMNQLELGMSKEQVTGILGKEYTIAEKRMEGGNQIEILSYRNSPETDEFYQFVFVNNELERWYRELMPRYEVREN